MTSDNVIVLDVVTRHDIPAERVIGNIPEGMEAVVVVGFKEDGSFYFSSNKADGGDVLWLLEIAKKRLLEIGDE